VHLVTVPLKTVEYCVSRDEGVSPRHPTLTPRLLQILCFEFGISTWLPQQVTCVRTACYEGVNTVQKAAVIS
jgi:hypothetical protein